jgi:hypothetical protein
MAYSKAKLLKQSLEAIEKYKLIFIDDIIAYLPCSLATFYNHELEKVEDIKKALYTNKIKMKTGLRAKWYKNDHPSVQIALYKLIGTERECNRLNGNPDTAGEHEPDRLEKAFGMLTTFMQAQSGGAEKPKPTPEQQDI